jgi:hypothetical protein
MITPILLALIAYELCKWYELIERGNSERKHRPRPEVIRADADARKPPAHPAGTAATTGLRFGLLSELLSNRQKQQRRPFRIGVSCWIYWWSR